MAKVQRPRFPRQTTSGTAVTPPTANESRVGRTATEQQLSEIAVNPHTVLVKEIKTKENLLIQNKEGLNLPQAEQLMTNVKVAQANLTEALNALASYRKEVSNLLQQRRKEAASLRRQNAQQQNLDVIEPAPLVEKPGPDSNQAPIDY